MNTCQIAFAFKNRVVCLEEFKANTPNVLQKMKTTVLRHLPVDDVDHQDIVLETICAGSHVTISSDQDAAKYVFGCAVDRKAKLRVKIPRRSRNVKEKCPERSISDGTIMEMPASAFVDHDFIRKLVTLLDSWANMEISYEDTCALVETLKSCIAQRETMASLIETLVRFLERNLNWNFTIPAVLSKRYDIWIAQATEEELLFVGEQVPSVLDKLLSRRGKLFEDVFLKQKPIQQILKLRFPKSRRNDHKGSFRKQLYSLENARFTSQELKQDLPLDQLHKHESGTDEDLVVVNKVCNDTGETDVDSEGHQELVNEKMRKYQAKLAKRMEKMGCKSVEELKELEASKKDARLARTLEKYGCGTEEELKQIRKEKRLAKKLERYGCQTKEEMKDIQLAKKLEKHGCETVEEFNDLRKQMKLSKSKLH